MVFDMGMKINNNKSNRTALISYQLFHRAIETMSVKIDRALKHQEILLLSENINKNEHYLLPTGIKKISQAHNIAMVQFSHYLEFAILQNICKIHETKTNKTNTDTQRNWNRSRQQFTQLLYRQLY